MALVMAELQPPIHDLNNKLSPALPYSSPWFITGMNAVNPKGPNDLHFNAGSGFVRLHVTDLGTCFLYLCNSLSMFLV